MPPRLQGDRLQDILVFLRVVEAGNLSAAARLLGLAPSTVSKLISRLEDRLKIRLLDRNSRAVTPTEDGAAFYRSSLAVLVALEEAEAMVMADDTQPTGTLRVHTVPAFAKYQLVRALPAFLARFPNLKLDLVLDVDHAALLSSGVDVAIHTGWIADSSLIARKFASSRWIICAAPSYLAAHGTPATPLDLLNHNCLCQPNSSPWSPWLVMADGVTTSVPVVGNVMKNLADILIEMACAGVGIVRIAEFCAADYLRSGQLVPLLQAFESTNDQPIIAYYRTRKHLSPRIRVFLDFLQEEFGQQPWKVAT